MNSSLNVVPFVVVGVGNPMRGDDGIGPAAIGLLRQPGLAADVELMVIDGEATRLVEAWQGRHVAVVVDATILGSVPGSIHRVEVGVDQLPGWSPGASSHSTGLADAVELGRALDRLPQRLIIFGIEPANVALGAGLSKPVEAALPTLVQAIEGELARHQAAQGGGRQKPGTQELAGLSDSFHSANRST